MANGERTHYLQTDGTYLLSHVGHQLFEEAKAVPVAQVEQDDLAWLEEGTNPSAGALAMVSHRLVRNLPRFHAGENDREFYDRYDISYMDRRRAEGMTLHTGLADLEFTWFFAPGIANSIAESFKVAGLISNEQHENMTLGDWAGMMRTPWFITILHDLSVTRNGLWGGFGAGGSTYTEGALQEHLDDTLTQRGTRAFNVGVQRDEQSGTEYLVAEVTRELTTLLHREIQGKDSPGCIGARKIITATFEDGLHNRHLRYLTEHGYFRPVRIIESRQNVQYDQPVTPIQHATLVLADKLDEYNSQFGTPYARDVFRRGRRFIAHEARPNTNVLMRPIPFEEG